MGRSLLLSISVLILGIAGIEASAEFQLGNDGYIVSGGVDSVELMRRPGRRPPDRCRRGRCDRPGRRGRWVSQRLVLPFNGQIFHGRSVIALKRMIRRHYRINLQNAKLSRVILVAKTAAGLGTAELKVGWRSMDRQRVPGNQRNWPREGMGTYYRTGLQSWGASQGTWQVHLNGNFKIRRIAVVVQRWVPGRGGPGRRGPGRR